MEQDLSKTAVKACLKTAWLGHHYIHFPTIGSTNDYLKRQSELPTGTVVTTDFQERGRGRFSRVWQAPAGTSLLVSALLRPKWPAEQLTWVGMVAGLAACEAIEQLTNLSIGLKWPNDLVVAQNDIWHKVSGLLVETSWLTTSPYPHVVLGMGLNVNIETADLPAAPTPATSLKEATGHPISRRNLLCRFLERFEARYEQVNQGHSPQPAWEKRLVTLGEWVQVTAVRDGDSFEGHAEGTNEWGQLLVRDAKGVQHAIGAGDVTLRKR